VKALLLTRDYKESIDQLRGEFPAPSHVTITIETNSEIIASHDKTIAVFVRQAIPADLYKLAFELFSPVKGLISNRATALGTRSLPRSVSPNGVLSKRSGVNAELLKVIDARQGILGYSGRPPRLTRLTVERPEMLDGNKRLLHLIDKIYQKLMPDQYRMQRAQVSKAPRFGLGQTCFTSIYVVKKLRTAYHLDTNNLHGTMTALIAMGDFTGGELVLPRWRVAFALRPGDLLLFDPQQLHGNLPFTGNRLSVAFYCMKSIADCAM